MYVATNSALLTNTVSWTGRIPAGTILSPNYYLGVAGNLLGDTRYLNSITVVQMCSCI
jgi:hypothetical protein